MIDNQRKAVEIVERDSEPALFILSQTATKPAPIATPTLGQAKMKYTVLSVPDAETKLKAAQRGLEDFKEEIQAKQASVKRDIDLAIRNYEGANGEHSIRASNNQHWIDHVAPAKLAELANNVRETEILLRIAQLVELEKHSPANDLASSVQYRDKAAKELEKAEAEVQRHSARNTQHLVERQSRAQGLLSLGVSSDDMTNEVWPIVYKASKGRK